MKIKIQDQISYGYKYMVHIRVVTFQYRLLEPRLKAFLCEILQSSKLCTQCDEARIRDVPVGQESVVVLELELWWSAISSKPVLSYITYHFIQFRHATGRRRGPLNRLSDGFTPISSAAEWYIKIYKLHTFLCNCCQLRVRSPGVGDVEKLA